MAEIDRGTSESSRCKESKLPKIIMVALVAAFLFASSLSLLLDPSSEIPPAPVLVRISYTSHANIYINGNAGFLGLNTSTGISWGSGTASDPYIIQGWDIGALSADGIWIRNANVYFIIRNCYLNCGGNNWDGVRLTSCSNGIIVNNLIKENHEGIRLDSSSSNTLSNNSCLSNVINGICLNHSSSNTLSYNILSTAWMEPSPDRGIYLLSDSNYNTLSNNNCSSNDYYGIYVYSSSSNTLSWNQLRDNVREGVRIDSGSGNTICNNTFIGNRGAGSVYDVNHIQARDNGTNNWWNASGTPHGYGNNWSDWRAPDVNWDGIVDNPYNISGTAGAKDYYPLTIPGTPIPEFSEIIVPMVGLMLIALVFRRVRKSLS
jgi:parallel beta-helix repeat protein